MSHFTTVPKERDQLRAHLIETMGETQGLALFERLDLSPYLGMLSDAAEFWPMALAEFLEGGVEALEVYAA